MVIPGFSPFRIQTWKFDDSCANECVSQTHLSVVEPCSLNLDEDLAVLEGWDISLFEHGVELVQVTLVHRLAGDNCSGTLGDVAGSHEQG